MVGSVSRLGLAAVVGAVASLGPRPDAALAADAGGPPRNLLLNPTFEFHGFENHRDGKVKGFSSGSVAFWTTAAWSDVTVMREAHAPANVRPAFAVGNVVSIAPGKRFWQVIPLPEAGLVHGDRVSLRVRGFQTAPDGLRARLVSLKLDSEDGSWVPADLGADDKRTFPRRSRGELIPVRVHEARSDQAGPVDLKIENVEVLGRFHQDESGHSEDVNTVALRVEFENASERGEAWVASACLCRGPEALDQLPPARDMAPYYRHIPRTMQKLWKGEPVHIVVMGSSIDRGSANPPLYFYDENPQSPTFKKPLAWGKFDAGLAGRPDLEGYVGEWRHYYSYAGRLRLHLMCAFNLPVSALCLNFMACDGSCIGESHSGIADYCSLSLPPSEGVNGHPAGKTWQDLYPGLFSRSEGPGPDLVVLGSGANEPTDRPDEVAVFEGMIRWVQRRYPHAEFLFCMFNNFTQYTANVGDLQALALRYGIPYLDYGRLADDLCRSCDRWALVPRDGHPQAAAHFFWSMVIGRAFECWDPVLPGQAQLRLPERAHPNSYGWEGDVVTYDERSGRIKGNRFIFDDTAVNCWATWEEGDLTPYVDGLNPKTPARGKFTARDLRNSTFRHGRCRLGDRHIVELAGKGARLVCVDAKQCPDRRFLGVDHPLWRLGGLPASDFASEWGAPFGAKRVALETGQGVEIDVIATDVSVAYVDVPAAGRVRVLVDGVERLAQPANVPYVDQEKREHFLENRKGILGLGFGWHTVRIECLDASVSVLGVFTYDSRPNRAAERRITGQAVAGETVAFTPPFRARPVVRCFGGLTVANEDITPASVRFVGDGFGGFEVVGE